MTFKTSTFSPRTSIVDGLSITSTVFKIDWLKHQLICRIKYWVKTLNPNRKDKNFFDRLVQFFYPFGMTLQLLWPHLSTAIQVSNTESTCTQVLTSQYSTIWTNFHYYLFKMFTDMWLASLLLNNYHCPPKTGLI
jgi:hypothetical protein